MVLLKYTFESRNSVDKDQQTTKPACKYVNEQE